MESPSSEGAVRGASWEWDGEAGDGGEAPGDVIGGGGDGPWLDRRRVLIGAGVLAAGAAVWAFGRSGAGDALPAPKPSRPEPTALSGPTPVWTYRGPEAMTPERLTDPPGRPVYLSKTGLQVLDPAQGTAARLLVFDPPATRDWPSDLDMLGKVVIGPDRLFTTTYEGHLEARHFTDPAADWSLPLPEELQGHQTRLSGYDRGVLYGHSWSYPHEVDSRPQSRLFALRVADRSFLWNVPTDTEEQPITPATTGANLLACVRFLGNRAELVARDAATGRQLWTAGGDEDLRWCATGPQEVYVPDGNGGVRMLRPTGEPGWTYSPARGESWRALPPVPDGPRVYVARDQGIVTCHDASTGAVLWSCRLPFLLDRRSHPVVAGRTLFVPGTAAGGVTAIHTSTGEPVWTFRDSGPGRDVWTLASDAVHLYAGHDDVLHALPLG
ncbi:outer membrane protein assembly factor BamB family protein [Streptomyces sp. 1331.2]|uniref:outer membrane protein assembly factor BamB family protein n=1 Tax=Streptomyces sp. 1331.2 TaxID=1938835 RepID=UPI000BE47348|nr:PQQ-binding-like beta-propeller repeat protein [Streptomyces sp. 1331.2]